jgi:hypothetical protein
LALVACGDRTDTPPAARDAGPRDAGMEAACETWLVTYDLTGSQFEVRGVFGGDRTQDIGPGELTIRYPTTATRERAREGEVALVDYAMTLAFDESGIVTDIQTSAPPDECGLAVGTLETSTVTWSTGIASHMARGTVTCIGDELVCAFAGLPVDEPQRRDDDYELPLAPFAFSDDGRAFTSAFVQIPSPEDPGDSFIRLAGTETSSVCVPTPSC